MQPAERSDDGIVEAGMTGGVLFLAHHLALRSVSARRSDTPVHFFSDCRWLWQSISFHLLELVHS